MERRLANAVRQGFETVLGEIWPEFERARDPLPVPRGFRLYRWQTNANLWLYLCLGILPRSNEFTVELLWNTVDQCPVEIFPPPCNEDIAASAKNRCQIIVPIGQAFQNKVWKVGTNPAFQPEVVVRSAIREMKDFATPIIRSVLERHGTKP